MLVLGIYLQPKLQIIPFELHNVTDVFAENESKMVKNILNTENNNALALGLSLPGFTGKLVVEYAINQYGNNSDISWAIAGRNREKLEKVFAKVGFVFLYAPLHHQSMKHVAESRKTIAPDKTIFNLLVHLTNPESAKRQSLGVYDSKWILPVAETLKNLGAHKALVFHSDDGLDEISSADKTLVAELNNGNISEYEIDPKAFDVYQNNLEDLQINSPSEIYSTTGSDSLSCYNLCDGNVYVTAFGGTPPYNYSWDYGTNNLCAGLYNILVTDTNGCSFSDAVTTPDLSLIHI